MKKLFSNKGLNGISKIARTVTMASVFIASLTFAGDNSKITQKKANIWFNFVNNGRTALIKTKDPGYAFMQKNNIENDYWRNVLLMYSVKENRCIVDFGHTHMFSTVEYGNMANYSYNDLSNAYLKTCKQANTRILEMASIFNIVGKSIKKATDFSSIILFPKNPKEAIKLITKKLINKPVDNQVDKLQKIADEELKQMLNPYKKED